MTNSTGGWRFAAEGDGTHVDYRAAIDVKAPLPGFVLRKMTDGLVAASIPNMFAGDRRARSAASAEGSARATQSAGLETPGCRGT